MASIVPSIYQTLLQCLVSQRNFNQVMRWAHPFMLLSFTACRPSVSILTLCWRVLFGLLWTDIAEKFVGTMEMMEHRYGAKDFETSKDTRLLPPGTFYLTQVDSMYWRFYDQKPVVKTAGGKAKCCNGLQMATSGVPWTPRSPASLLIDPSCSVLW